VGLTAAVTRDENGHFCLEGGAMAPRSEKYVPSVDGQQLGYPLVMSKVAIENGHRNSGFSHEKW